MAMFGGSLSIRSSLALLVAACVVPGSVVAVFLIVGDYDLRRDQLSRDTIATARALVSALDQDLASVESGLHVLAVSPQLVSGNLAAFHRHAKDALPSQKSFNYVLMDPSGRQALNTLRVFGEPLPQVAASLQAQQVFQTGKTVVTDIFIGPVSGKPTLAMAVPVRRDGQLVYALNVGISPDRVLALLRKQRLPQGWIGLALDRTGHVIARTLDMERYVGKKAVPALVSAAQAASEGSIETVTLEGIPVISAFSRSEVSGWTVAVGIPTSVLTDGLRQSLWLLIATTALLLLGGLWAAWYYGERIAKAFRGLVVLALELGQGKELKAPNFRLREADDVGQSLVVASTLLQNARHDAYYDALTGLASVALFHQLLNQQHAVCVRDDSKLAVLFIDLDGFKAVNDTHGHAAGDDVLRAVATRIQGGLRGSDIAARLGGDEFAVLLRQSDTENAKRVAEKLIGILGAPYQLATLEARISASIGIAVFPDSGATTASVLQCADTAMYAAKNAGKNRYMVAPMRGGETSQ